jgi:hypothetical protein
VTNLGHRTQRHLRKGGGEALGVVEDGDGDGDAAGNRVR